MTRCVMALRAAAWRVVCVLRASGADATEVAVEYAGLHTRRGGGAGVTWWWTRSPCGMRTVPSRLPVVSSLGGHVGSELATQLLGRSIMRCVLCKAGAAAAG